MNLGVLFIFITWFWFWFWFWFLILFGPCSEGRIAKSEKNDVDIVRG